MFVCFVAHFTLRLLLEIPKVNEFLHPSMEEKENRIFILTVERDQVALLSIALLQN